MGTHKDLTVFDTQNALHGRSASLPIPGLPIRGKDDEWYNVLSVGPEGAGLPLHAHGAAWIALGGGGEGASGGRKRWALFAPGFDSSAVHRGLPPLMNASSWFASANIAAGGGRRCTQPPGSVLLVPDGWGHATLNEGGESWAVGRQRPRRLLAWLHSARKSVDRAAPAQSPPHALLQLGQALCQQVMQRGAAPPGQREAAVQQAFGMLVVAARLQRTRPLAASPVPAPAVRLAALFALLGGLAPPHWSGAAPGLAGARQAARAAAKDLASSGLPAAAASDALVYIGTWWARVGGDEAQALKAFEAAFKVAPRGVAPLAALHAGCALARSERCDAAARPLREAERMRAAELWRPVGDQAGQLDDALRRCRA